MQSRKKGIVLEYMVDWNSVIQGERSLLMQFSISEVCNLKDHGATETSKLSYLLSSLGFYSAGDF